MVPPEIQEVFGQEICHEGVHREKVNAALALRDAIEDEDDGGADEGVEAGVVHGGDRGLRPTPESVEIRLLVFQNEEGNDDEEGIGDEAGEERQDVVIRRVLVRSVGHLARETQEVFLQDQSQEALPSLLIGSDIPHERQHAREQTHHDELSAQRQEFLSFN